MYKRCCVRCFHCEACSHLDLEGAMFKMDATNCPHYLCVPEPEEFACTMKTTAEFYNDDLELRHEMMDNRMLDLLKSFGYGDAVKIFKNTRKLYA